LWQHDGVLVTKIGLALSGGGFRAAIFHSGVLLRLADEGLLESVSGLSTVSGGSLGVSLIMSKSGMQWPRSIDFRNSIFAEFRRTITSVDLLTLKAGLDGLARYPLRLFLDRARVLADSLARNWGVAATLDQLPDEPVWWINATCVETGKNWRFSKREMGDWKFGRHYNPPFKLAEAVAASAAIPYGIGALKLDLRFEGWFRTDPATRRPLERTVPSRSIVRLWDGGAYENLGLEAMYKPQESLRGCDFLICSDASGPLGPPSSVAAKVAALFKGDLAGPRVFDIAGDQIRALRSRMFMADVMSGRVRGALLRMGNSVREVHMKAGHAWGNPADYDAYLSDTEVAQALLYPSGLKAVPLSVFDRISRHGYELADSALTIYSPGEFRKSFRWAA
jgi:NTE family protein